MAKQTANDGVIFDDATPQKPGVYLAARAVDGPRFLVLVARIQGVFWGQLIDGESQAQKIPELKKRTAANPVNRFRNLLWAKAD